MRKATKNSPTKEKILETAQKLMIVKGYEATSVDEICKESGVAKGSFFHYFKNKEALGKEAIATFSQKNGQMMMESCCSIKDPLERIYQCLDWASETASKKDVKGCLVGTFAQEISDTSPELRKCCEKVFDETMKYFEEDLKAAKKLYAPKSSIDPRTLAQFLLSIFQGSFVVMKASEEKKVIQANIKHMKEYLKSIFGK